MVNQFFFPAVCGHQIVFAFAHEAKINLIERVAMWISPTSK